MRTFQVIERALKCFLAALVALVLLGALYSLVFSLARPEEYPSFFGYSRACVISGSMEPTISQGDHIIFCRSDEYSVGDIVVYYDGTDDIFISHRIIAETADGFILKGDYNAEPDPSPVDAGQIQGKVVYTLPDMQTYMNILTGVLLTVGVQLVMGAVKSYFSEKSTEEDAHEEKIQ